MADDNDNDLHVEVFAMTSTTSTCELLSLGESQVADVGALATKVALDRSEASQKPLMSLFAGKAPTVQDCRMRAERLQGGIKAKKSARSPSPSNASSAESGSPCDGDSSDSDSDSGSADSTGKKTRAASHLSVNTKVADVAGGGVASASNDNAPLTTPKKGLKKRGSSGAIDVSDAGDTPLRRSGSTKILKVDIGDGVFLECVEKVQPRKKRLGDDDDLRSVATSTSPGLARKQRALPPQYWIDRLSFQEAAQGVTDQRVLVQATNCISRERQPGKDKVGADRLAKHVSKFTVVEHLSEAKIMHASDDELMAALRALHAAAEPVPPVCLVGLWERRAKDAIRDAKRSNEVRDMEIAFAVMLPFSLIEDQAFVVSSPLLSPLAHVLQPSLVADKYKRMVTVGLVCETVSESATEEQLGSLRKMCAVGL